MVACFALPHPKSTVMAVTALPGMEGVAVQVAATVSSSISIIGCLFTLFHYARKTRLARRSSSNALMAVLAVLNVAICVCFLVGEAVKEDTGLCTAQGVGIQFFGLASVIVTCELALNMYLFVCKGSSDLRLRRNLKWYMVVAVVVPLITCIVLGAAEEYGDAEVWCWVKDPVYQFMLFFFFVTCGW